MDFIDSLLEARGNAEAERERKKNIITAKKRLKRMEKTVRKIRNE